MRRHAHRGAARRRGSRPAGSRRGGVQGLATAAVLAVLLTFGAPPAFATHVVSWGIGSPEGDRAAEVTGPTEFVVSVSLDGEPLAGWPMSARVVDASGGLIDTIEFGTDAQGVGSFTVPPPGDGGPYTVEVCDDDGCVYGDATLTAQAASPAPVGEVSVTDDPATETVGPEATAVADDPEPARGESGQPWLLLALGGALIALVGVGLYVASSRAPRRR